LREKAGEGKGRREKREGRREREKGGVGRERKKDGKVEEERSERGEEREEREGRMGKSERGEGGRSERWGEGWWSLVHKNTWWRKVVVVHCGARLLVTFHCLFEKYPYFAPNIHFLLKHTLKINGSTTPLYRYSERLRLL
jgi:hypothetical protein